MVKEKNKYKYWITKDKRKIAVKDMTNQHIINTLKMLDRNKFIAASTLEFYMSTSGPSGDMAQLAFEQELDEVLDRIPTRWIDIFNKELKIRGLIR